MAHIWIAARDVKAELPENSAAFAKERQTGGAANTFSR